MLVVMIARRNAFFILSTTVLLSFNFGVISKWGIAARKGWICGNTQEHRRVIRRIMEKYPEGGKWIIRRRRSRNGCWRRGNRGRTSLWIRPDSVTRARRDPSRGSRSSCRADRRQGECRLGAAAYIWDRWRASAVWHSQPYSLNSHRLTNRGRAAALPFEIPRGFSETGPLARIGDLRWGRDAVPLGAIRLVAA